MGRDTTGVIGITLRKDNDVVVEMDVVDEKAHLLSVTENGYGKRSEVAEYRYQGRGGSGVINVKVTEKNGPVVGIKSVTDADQLLLITERGQLIRIKVKDIRETGRAAQGVRVINLEEGDRVVGVAKLAEPDETEEEAAGFPAGARAEPDGPRQGEGPRQEARSAPVPRRGATTRTIRLGRGRRRLPIAAWVALPAIESAPHAIFSRQRERRRGPPDQGPRASRRGLALARRRRGGGRRLPQGGPRARVADRRPGARRDGLRRPEGHVQGGAASSPSSARTSSSGCR